jgi:hypothetical protein
MMRQKVQDFEGPVICNNNRLSISLSQQPFLLDPTKAEFERPYKQLMETATPMELACAQKNDKHFLVLTYSFGVSECGGKCEIPLFLREDGAVLKFSGQTDEAPDLSGVNSIRIER